IYSNTTMLDNHPTAAPRVRRSATSASAGSAPPRIRSIKDENTSLAPASEIGSVGAITARAPASMHDLATPHGAGLTCTRPALQPARITIGDPVSAAVRTSAAVSR